MNLCRCDQIKAPIPEKPEWTLNATPRILWKGKSNRTHKTTGRETVVQPHPRNSKEFFPKLEDPRALPRCPKENASLLPHDSKLLASCWKRMKSSNFKISMWYLSGAVPGVWCIGWYDMIGTRIRMMWLVAITAPTATSIYSMPLPGILLKRILLNM